MPSAPSEGRWAPELVSGVSCIHVACKRMWPMRNYDFAPLTRSTVGFDRVFDLLDSAFTAVADRRGLSALQHRQDRRHIVPDRARGRRLRTGRPVDRRAGERPDRLGQQERQPAAALSPSWHRQPSLRAPVQSGGLRQGGEGRSGERRCSRSTWFVRSPKPCGRARSRSAAPRSSRNRSSRRPPEVCLCAGGLAARAPRLNENGGPMFRCFFLGPDGHFVGAKEVEAPEKHAAIEEARKVLRAGEVRQATGFELWRGTEMVFSSAPSRASGPDRSEAGASRQAAPEVVEVRAPGSGRAE